MWCAPVSINARNFKSILCIFAKFSFKLFNNSTSSLGIPDNINLGSFSAFSNSEEQIFTLINDSFDIFLI